MSSSLTGHSGLSTIQASMIIVLAPSVEMLKQGVHPKIVQERLGHASIQITLDTYSHVALGLQEAAAVRFDEALAPTPKKELVENLG